MKDLARKTGKQLVMNKMSRGSTEAPNSIQKPSFTQLTQEEL